MHKWIDFRNLHKPRICLQAQTLCPRKESQPHYEKTEDRGQTGQCSGAFAGIDLGSGAGTAAAIMVHVEWVINESQDNQKSFHSNHVEKYNTFKFDLILCKEYEPLLLARHQISMPQGYHDKYREIYFVHDILQKDGEACRGEAKIHLVRTKKTE